MFLLIDHHQQTYAGIDHAGARGLDVLQRSNGTGSDQGKVGHHRQGGVIQVHQLGQGLAGLEIGRALLQGHGGEGGISVGH